MAGWMDGYLQKTTTTERFLSSPTNSPPLHFWLALSRLLPPFDCFHESKPALGASTKPSELEKHNRRNERRKRSVEMVSAPFDAIPKTTRTRTTTTPTAAAAAAAEAEAATTGGACEGEEESVSAMCWGVFFCFVFFCYFLFLLPLTVAAVLPLPPSRP